MDIPKFIDLISTRELNFANLALMRATDPREGVIPRDLIPAVALKLGPLGLPDNPTIQRLINNKADYVYVNSWHLNEEESMAMWRLYSPNHGIAIRSTFERLHSALQDAESEISAGMIAYEDMTAPPPNVSDPLSYAFRKHAAYRDEHEMRLAVVETPTMGVAFDPHPVSIRIRVDVDALIDQVVVAPGAPAYLLAAVRTVMNHWLPEIHPLPSNLLTPLAY